MQTKTRLYIGQPLSQGLKVELSDAQFHQLKTVQRLESGALLGLFDGITGEWVAELQLQKKAATALVREQVRPWQALPELALLFAPIKSARLDFMIEKATELGVTAADPGTDRAYAGRAG